MLIELKRAHAHTRVLVIHQSVDGVPLIIQNECQNMKRHVRNNNSLSLTFIFATHGGEADRDSFVP